MTPVKIFIIIILVLFWLSAIGGAVYYFGWIYGKSDEDTKDTNESTGNESNSSSSSSTITTSSSANDASRAIEKGSKFDSWLGLIKRIYGLDNTSDKCSADSADAQCSRVMVSPNGKNFAFMSASGMVSILENGEYTYSTPSYSGTYKAPHNWWMQKDGNLVTYNADKGALWSTKTNKGESNGPYKAVIQDDGNFVVYGKSAYWASKSQSIYKSTTFSLATDAIPDILQSPDKKYMVFFINNGTIVIVDITTLTIVRVHKPVSNPSGTDYSYVMQSDGNFVIRDSSRSAKWASGSNGKGTAPYILGIDNDTRLKIIDNTGNTIWSVL